MKLGTLKFLAFCTKEYCYKILPCDSQNDVLLCIFDKLSQGNKIFYQMRTKLKFQNVARVMHLCI